MIPVPQTSYYDPTYVSTLRIANRPNAVGMTDFVKLASAGLRKRIYTIGPMPPMP